MYEGAQTYFKMKVQKWPHFSTYVHKSHFAALAVASTQPYQKTASGRLWASTVSWGPGNI